jgi:hypothetical protein
MAMLGNGVLLTFAEVPAEAEDDFNEWYNREHIGERLLMPGFLRARRYIAVSGRPKYCATYETANVEDLGHPDYLARLADQSDWSKRVMAQFSRFHRLTARVTADTGHGVAGALTLTRFYPDEGIKEPLRDWLAQTGLPALAARPGMVGASLLENDIDVANAPARNDPGGDFPIAERQEWAVLVDGADTEACVAATRDLIGPAALALRGVDGDIEVAGYRFLFGNHR